MNSSISSDSNISVASDNIHNSNNNANKLILSNGSRSRSRSPSPSNSTTSSHTINVHHHKQQIQQAHTHQLNMSSTSPSSSSVHSHKNSISSNKDDRKRKLMRELSSTTPIPHSPGPSSSTTLLPPPPPPPVPIQMQSSPSTVCNAKQLSKLKRFLTTLQQFAADISPEISDRVRHLILELINSNISVEDFHSRLQETTHFPLRPFVIPFLKANLPLLQRELLYLARISKQTIGECFILHPEASLNRNSFDPAHLTTNINQYLNVNSINVQNSAIKHPHHINNSGHSMNSGEKFQNINERAFEKLNYKRSKSPDHHNINMHHHDSSEMNMIPPPPKRSNVQTPTIAPIGLSVNQLAVSLPQPSQPSQQHQQQNTNSPTLSQQLLQSANSLMQNSLLLNSNKIKLEDMSMWRELKEKERMFSNYMRDFEQDYREIFDRNLDDDYKNVDSMLNCILDMVGKTKRAMTVLQTKTLQFQRYIDNYEGDVKRKHAELMSHTVRHAEDRVNEIRKKAEDAVNDVKNQAAIELKRAVTSAEQKASEIIKREREHFDKVMQEAQKKINEDVMLRNRNSPQADNQDENCWNCGRKALETCTGCNKAKYCSQFCQHKHWENNHHKVCMNNREENIPSISDNELDVEQIQTNYTNNESQKNFNNNQQQQDPQQQLTFKQNNGNFSERPNKKYLNVNTSANNSSCSSTSSTSVASSPSILAKIHQANANENIAV